MKKFLASLLLVVMLSPVVAIAVMLPLGFGLALVTGVATSSLILPLVASSVIVGAAISYFTLGGSPGAAQSTSAIIVNVNPKIPLPTPAGWTAPVAPSIQPQPPNGFNASVKYGMTEMGVSFISTTASDVCTRLNTLVPSSTWTYYTSPGFNGSCLRSSNGLYYNVGGVEVCPTGYTRNTVPNPDTCTVTTPGTIVKPADNACQIIRTGNTYATDSFDADCQAGLPPRIGVTTSGVTDQGDTSTGDGYTAAVVTLNADGTVTATKTKDNGDGTSTSTTVKGSAPDATTGEVKVIGISETQQKGAGTLTAPDPGPLTMPTDYNRETTQAAVKSGIDSLNSKLDPSGISSTLSTTDYAAKEAAHGSQLSGIGGAGLTNHGVLWSWSPIIPSTTCYEPVMAFAGRSITLTWCSKIELLKEILAWVFFVLTGFGIFEMMTRKGG